MGVQNKLIAKLVELEHAAAGCGGRCFGFDALAARWDPSSGSHYSLRFLGRITVQPFQVALQFEISGSHYSSVDSTSISTGSESSRFEGSTTMLSLVPLASSDSSNPLKNSAP